MLSQVQHQTEATRFLQQFVEGRLVSPVLLLGPEGVGRRFSVIHAIQEVFCQGTKEPGCACASCYQVLRGIHRDVVVLQAVESDIGINEVRGLIAAAQNYPTEADIRCFIIDGADRFTQPAANAFLKTLEEPPAHARFFLIAESAEYVLPTIRSRCGSIRYHPLPEAFVLSVLHQHEEDAKALVYARMGEGSVGLAVGYWGSGRLALRDQVLRVLQLAVERDLPALFSLVDAMDENLVLALKLLEQALHDVLIVRVDPKRVVNVDCVDVLTTMAKKSSVKVWSQLARKVRALQSQYRTTRLHLPFHFKTILIESFI
jgi:DNA polymerase-3 subunit delta'